MMTNELLPCPFCGSNDLRQVIHDLSGDDKEPFGYSISCNVCFVDLPPEPTQSDCFKVWNTRADKAVPEGWKILEKIEALIRQKKGFYSISVGHDEVKRAHKAGILKGLDVVHEEVKKAMLSAAPQPPTGD